MIDVVIPARNEENTIGPIVDEFLTHPLISQVHVIIDADTTDHTAHVASKNGAMIHNNFGNGKGQLLKAGMQFVTTERVIFCDADLIGLTQGHITTLAHPAHKGLLIGVPDYPDPPPYSDIRQDRLWWSWPFVSGERSMPTSLVKPLNLHGYLAETQINNEIRRTYGEIEIVRLYGLTSPFNLDEKRLAEMERDRKWAIKNGVPL